MKRKADILLALLICIFIGVFGGIMIFVMVSGCGIEGDDRSPFCIDAQDPDGDYVDPICEPEPTASASPSPT